MLVTLLKLGLGRSLSGILKEVTESVKDGKDVTEVSVEVRPTAWRVPTAKERRRFSSNILTWTSAGVNMFSSFLVPRTYSSPKPHDQSWLVEESSGLSNICKAWL